MQHEKNEDGAVAVQIEFVPCRDEVPSAALDEVRAVKCQVALLSTVRSSRRGTQDVPQPDLAVQGTKEQAQKPNLRLAQSSGNTVTVVIQELLNVLTLGVSTGIAAGAYNALKTWVDARNGRKLKIKVGDIEVEATQMKEEDVLRIFELLEEKADRKKVRDFLLEANKKEADKREERRPELQ